MPKDFTKKSFSKILRGYSPDEVDEYIAYINEEFARLERRNSENERKLALALDRIDSLTDSAARRENERVTSENARAAAEKTAESILSEAAVQAEAILEAAKTEADGVYKAASDMYDEVTSFRDSLFELYNDHIVAIEGITESAKNYINKVDSAYSEVGEAVPHDEDEDDDDVLSYEDADDADMPAEMTNGMDAATDEDAEETRVLDLNLLREDAYEPNEAEDELQYDDMLYDDSGDFEELSDFDESAENIANSFREMDSLFTEAVSSPADEFDIVFADTEQQKKSDSRTQKQPPRGQEKNRNKFGRR